MTAISQLPKKPPRLPDLSNEDRRWFDVVTSELKKIFGKIDLTTGGAGVNFGDPSTDGSWRITVSGDTLLVQRRASGSWVTYHTYGA